MLWEAFLLFSPIRTSAGQYQGRRSGKKSKSRELEAAVRRKEAIEIRQVVGKAVADAFDAIKRDAAHGREPSDGRCLHIDQGGVIGRGKPPLFGLISHLRASHKPQISSSRVTGKALARERVNHPGHVVCRTGGSACAERSGPANREDEIDGTALFDRSKGASGGCLAGSSAGSNPLFLFAPLRPEADAVSNAGRPVRAGGTEV